MTLLRVVAEMAVTLTPGVRPDWRPTLTLTPWFVPFRGRNTLSLHHAPASAAPPQLGTNRKPDLREGFPFPAASVKTWCHDIILRVVALMALMALRLPGGFGFGADPVEFASHPCPSGSSLVPARSKSFLPLNRSRIRYGEPGSGEGGDSGQGRLPM